MLHRYAQLSSHPLVDAEVHYYIGNPGSYMYLDDRRPQTGIGGARSRKGCPTYNDYKVRERGKRTRGRGDALLIEVSCSTA